MENKYIINFVDENKPPLEILPNTVDGPSGNTRKTDLDLTGMGTSLWGEMNLENLIHILENFACDEDMHDIASISSSTTMLIDGNVVKSFNNISSFVIVESPTIVTTFFLNISFPPSYDSINDLTTITIISGDLNIVSLPAQAGTPGRPNQNLSFSPINPQEGQTWYNKTTGQTNVWDATGQGTWKRTGNVTISNVAPANPENGDLWWDSTNTYVASDPEYGRNLKIYLTTGGWRFVVQDYLPRNGSKIMTGDLNLGSNRITNLPDPLLANPQDAVTVNFAQNMYVNVNGDTMTGILDLNSNRITNVGNATTITDALNSQSGDLRYPQLTTDNILTGDLTFNGSTTLSGSSLTISGYWGSFSSGIITNGNVNVGDHIVFGDSAVSRIYIGPTTTDDTYIELGKGGSNRDINFVCYGNEGLSIRGNTFSGAYRVVVSEDFQIFGTNDIDMGSNRVRKVADPSDVLDATNKQYVDAVVGGIGAVVAPYYSHYFHHTAVRGGYLTINPTTAGYYLIIAHGVTNNRGNNNNITLHAPRLVNNFGVVLAYSGPSAGRKINWPDGNAPASAIFKYYISSSITFRVLIDSNVTVDYMTAIRMKHEA